MEFASTRKLIRTESGNYLRVKSSQYSNIKIFLSIEKKAGGKFLSFFLSVFLFLSLDNTILKSSSEELNFRW